MTDVALGLVQRGISISAHEGMKEYRYIIVFLFFAMAIPVHRNKKEEETGRQADPSEAKKLRRGLTLTRPSSPPARARRDPAPSSPPPPPMATSTFSGDETAPFFGFLGAAAALVFSCKHPSDLCPYLFPAGIHPFLTPPPLTLSL